MKLPLVTIIVPVYNLEKYISDCIESIVSQTFDSIEILLIDDGSTDNSSRICDSYSARYPNICVFHNANSGVSKARNFGIENSHGKYIMFVDGDDVINKQTVSILYDDLQKTGADVASATMVETWDNDIKREFSRKDINYKEPYVVTKSEMLKKFLSGDSITSTSRLYRKEQLCDIRFFEGRKYHEDKYFLFQCYLKGKTFSRRVEPVYCQYRHSDSSSGIMGKYTDDSIFFSNLILQQIECNHPEMTRLAKTNDLQTRLNNIHNLFRKSVDIEFQKQIFRNRKSGIVNYEKDVIRELSVKNKIEVCFLRLGFYSYRFCVKSFDRIFRKQLRV